MSAAGDVDGDAVDDLLISFAGGECSDCTASDRGKMESIGGAVVVFGGSDVAADGTLDPDHDRKLKLEITVSYFEQCPWDKCGVRGAGKST